MEKIEAKKIEVGKGLSVEEINGIASKLLDGDMSVMGSMTMADADRVSQAMDAIAAKRHEAQKAELALQSKLDAIKMKAITSGLAEPTKAAIQAAKGDALLRQHSCAVYEVATYAHGINFAKVGTVPASMRKAVWETAEAVSKAVSVPVSVSGFRAHYNNRKRANGPIVALRHETLAKMFPNAK